MKKMFKAVPASLALLKRMANSPKGDPVRRAEAQRLLKLAETIHIKRK